MTRVTAKVTASTNTRTNTFGHRTVGNPRGWLRKQQRKGKNMTGSIHIGLAAIGSAIGVGIIGMKAAEATGRNPGAAGAIRNQAIIFAALAEGVIFITILMGKIGM